MISCESILQCSDMVREWCLFAAEKMELRKYAIMIKLRQDLQWNNFTPRVFLDIRPVRFALLKESILSVGIYVDKGRQ